ncbi:16S rRNA (guanine(527)-N(7))-methyltransferase RsmG [Celeribacter sp.]|uniref:16S rRNA (guanine(527)-N(7))-methyltransferase RsmG n=1 Tax=Celeribacter sp. TaxID=1890673 RepID=UPI003A936AE2
MRDLSTIGLNVSRETMERLEVYDGLLKKWNPAINLVSKYTLENTWGRHFLDSAQVFKVADATKGSWVDLGSGGGFPGVVCAIIAAELAPDLKFTLVESDQRKATFLRTVLRETGVEAQVLAKRVEEVEPLKATTLTARALSSLTNLLGFADRHLDQGGVAFFPKGMKYQEELSEAQAVWRFSHSEYKSVTDENAVIIKVGDIERA